MQRAFIIRPFGKKRDSAGVEVDFERTHTELIKPALIAAGLGGETTGEIIDAGNIREDMFSLIVEADLVICDITVHNANVFYELGIRHALRKRCSVLIKGEPTADAPPFDLLTDRYLPYDLSNPRGTTDALAEMIRATLASDRETDSPIFKMLPPLREVNPATIQVLPTDFTEEVRRATAAKEAGWLRLLAAEVAGKRFQWPALRTIGQAQQKLKDYEGACRTWEKVREAQPEDIAANLALANLYERQYRETHRAELLEASNQTVARVLKSEPTPSTRAEALALLGRNQKTLWRLDFENAVDLTSRREAATNRTLRKAYEAYRGAYLVDLNHYWSGLAALQMGTIALELANEAAWEDAFDDARDAETYRAELREQLPTLRVAVSLAVDAALQQLAQDDPNRVWGEISAADLTFLTEDRPRRVIRAYVDAVPSTDYFAWDAARGQLQLFASLGIKSELAGQIIATVDQKVVPCPPATDLHVIVFAGHRVDEPGRAVPRFPDDRAVRAKELIREAFQRAREDKSQLRVLASATPGADILCHEVCRELDIPGVVCLPIPEDDFARVAFGTLDAWRSRYLDLLRERTALHLSDQNGLPRWLQGSDLDPWERCNRWVVEMAQTAGARRVTLIALWDGQDTHDSMDATAHIVRIARAAGTLDVRLIDAAQLLK